MQHPFPQKFDGWSRKHKAKVWFSLLGVSVLSSFNVLVFGCVTQRHSISKKPVLQLSSNVMPEKRQVKYNSVHCMSMINFASQVLPLYETYSATLLTVSKFINNLTPTNSLTTLLVLILNQLHILHTPILNYLLYWIKICTFTNTTPQWHSIFKIWKSNMAHFESQN